MAKCAYFGLKVPIEKNLGGRARIAIENLQNYVHNNDLVRGGPNLNRRTPTGKS